MDFPSIISGIWDGFMSVLGEFLDTQYLLAFLICVAVAVIFNPKGPTPANQLIVSFVFSAIAAFLLVVLFRGPVTSAVVLAFVVLTAGLIWLLTTRDSWLGRVIVGVLGVASLTIVIAVAAPSPTSEFIPQAVNTIWAAVQTLTGSIGQAFS